MLTNPKKKFSIIAIILIVALFALLLYFTNLNLLYSYLLSINMITFLIYGYDKHQAKRAGMRIPEIVLHSIALMGGSAGALLGQLTFRHKIKKMKFIIVFYATLLLQVIVIFLLRDYLFEI
jgi:uncharacterized membrane protein YsdA (DUF1294 family)